MRKKATSQPQPPSISPEREAEISAAQQVRPELGLLFPRPKRLPLPTFYFVSPSHRNRLLTAMQKIGKISEGTLDFEYAVALYLLTADAERWSSVCRYVSREGIHFEEMLQEVSCSSGERTLLELAYNLFSANPETKIDLSCVTNLDQNNFQLVVSAIQLYWFGHVYGLQEADLAGGGNCDDVL